MKDKDDIEIDEKKLKRMLAQIIFLERKNSRTKQYGDNEIVGKIQKIIEEEIECL
ncbi:hypothetical protein AB2T63_05100 [Clostridium butyricum]|uniref:hypothetical protein n=1 Tax=Clostridium butyricum TaxID=1492 RepID=UPI0034677CFB